MISFWATFCSKILTEVNSLWNWACNMYSMYSSHYAAYIFLT
jgi:hypothetical protein